MVTSVHVGSAAILFALHLAATVSQASSFYVSFVTGEMNSSWCTHWSIHNDVQPLLAFSKVFLLGGTSVPIQHSTLFWCELLL